MKKQFRLWFAALALGLTALLAQAQPVTVEGVRFDPSIELGGQRLVLNGTGIRTRAIFKVYAAGLYVTKKSGDATELLAEKGARRVSLGMLRNVDAESFSKSLNEGIKANLSAAEFAALAPKIQALDAILKSVGEARKGDLINFDYTPEGGTRVTVNGQAKGSPIAGEDLFNAVLRIWIGKEPADSALKKGLLGQ